MQIWEILEQMQGQIAAEIRVMLKQPPIDPKNFGPESQARRIKAMRECAATAESDEERHNAWVKQHVDAGWVQGDVYDEAAKTHPNIMPFECLPRDVQSKARIFDIVSKAAAKLEAEFKLLPQLKTE